MNFKSADDIEPSSWSEKELRLFLLQYHQVAFYYTNYEQMRAGKVQFHLFKAKSNPVLNMLYKLL